MRGERIALLALGVLLAVTAAWWALALWPLPSETPAWLARAREVCFGRTESGLPDAGGWILLIGQPLGMLGLLLAGWRKSVGRGLGRMWATRSGRGAVATVSVLLLAGAVAAGLRVRTATAEPAWARPDPGGLPPANYPTLDRPAPKDLLVDQRGDSVGIDTFRGRPVLVTFAFGHCETICPVVVQRAARARETLASESDPALVVVTLDPWRDTPSRLPHLAERWNLSRSATLLSGEIDDVEAALDRWNVRRSRDELTGDVVHPALIYLVDRSGVIRYATRGEGVDAVVELVRRMEAAS